MTTPKPQPWMRQGLRCRPTPTVDLNAAPARRSGRGFAGAMSALLWALCVLVQAPAAEAADPRTTGANTPFAQEMLTAHNRLRCRHGAPPLVWNEAVADYAQRWVERAGFRHSDSYNSPLGPLGENLYATTGRVSAIEAVQLWYGESQGYDYTREGSMAAGHFTALIWQGARQIGCGQVGGTVSCNYLASAAMDCSVPNMSGCYVEQVRPVTRKASDCP
jgi:pathogenesis-related protein 1